MYQSSLESYIDVLRMIKRNFHRIDVEDFRILYKVYVRPLMEYAIQA